MLITPLTPVSSREPSRFCDLGIASRSCGVDAHSAAYARFNSASGYSNLILISLYIFDCAVIIFGLCI